mmetsp:Transcript_42279/g.82988  ORF Transcript_42279/g.82988 Transcript_42279/m.82988 type:complete len:281 (-) Transcript_42279:957-1799(-)
MGCGVTKLADTPEDKNGLDFRHLLAEGQTGDLIFVEGSRFSGQLIRLGTNSPWSHVALLVRDVPQELKTFFECSKQRMAEELFVFDSDISHDGKIDGVRLRPLCDVLETYVKYFGAQVVVGYRASLTQARTPDVAAGRGFSKSKHSKLYDFMRSVSHKKFDNQNIRGYVEMLFASIGWNARENDRYYFCSELIAEAFQQLDFMQEKEQGGDHANNFLPKSFQPSEKVDNLLLKGGDHVRYHGLRKVTQLSSVVEWVNTKYGTSAEEMNKYVAAGKESYHN